MAKTRRSSELIRRPGESSPQQRDANSQDALAGIDARLSDSTTPLQDAVILTRIRGELIEQDERRLDRSAVRAAASHQFWGKVAFSLLAIGTAIGLMTFGHRVEGFVLFGVGFHWLAPDFVTKLYTRTLGKDNSDAK